MGYLHINNLYKEQDILMFRECYAMEKIHGTSAHVAWKDGKVSFFSGGERHENFVALFDVAALEAGFKALGLPEVVVFGEAYGGKCQGMKATYGDKLRFVAFDVKVEDLWLSVPQAEAISKERLGLDFVHYVRIPAELEAMDRERDAFSVQAVKNGCGDDKKREGVVLRPLVELRKNNGERVIAKHKRDDFSERATPQKVVDPASLKVLEEASAIAEEWVTMERLRHVMDKLATDGKVLGMEDTPDVIRAMVEDVSREAAGEIVDSKEARKAIGKKAAGMFKQFLTLRMRVEAEPDGPVSVGGLAAKMGMPVNPQECQGGS